MTTDQGMLTAKDLKEELAKIDDQALIIGWTSERDKLTVEFAYTHRKPAQFYDIRVEIGETRSIRTEKFNVGNKGGK